MQRFGRYTVVRQLGSGGMADVFEAVAVGAEGFERRVAIKRIRPDQHDARHGRMFVDEARLAGRLHHGNIVAVLDYGFDGDAPFQVLELVDGPDLAALLREGPIPLGLALHIGREIAWALDHAHRAADDEGRSLGIVHRDVSASNVLLSRDGDVKLTDFGIAFATERSEATQAGTVKGKAAYMAPEQLTGAPVDGRSDLFGLACLIHRATTGATPLQEEDRMMRLLAGEPLPLHPTLPEDVRGVLAQALSLSRSDRPRDAASFAASLAELVSAHLTADPRHALRDLLRERTSSPAAATASLFDLALIDPDAARFERTETAEAPPPPAPKRMRWAV
ncbi:MAG: serine/threonine-protein kinase, partial [Myxococcota bacterium]